MEVERPTDLHHLFVKYSWFRLPLEKTAILTVGLLAVPSFLNLRLGFPLPTHGRQQNPSSHVVLEEGKCEGLWKLASKLYGGQGVRRDVVSERFVKR